MLIPNQHIGVYRVGFAAEWISREWLARHNGHIKMDKLEPARCPLLGYALKEMTIEGQKIRSKYLRTETQDRLGQDGYDAGAKILTDFLAKELDKFYTDDLDLLGREIIDCFQNAEPLKTIARLLQLSYKSIGKENRSTPKRRAPAFSFNLQDCVCVL